MYVINTSARSDPASSKRSEVPLLPPSWAALSLTEVANLAPVQLLNWRVAAERGLQLAIRREDLLHPSLGGNKFYKLAGHLDDVTHGALRLRMLAKGAAHHAAVPLRSLGDPSQYRVSTFLRMPGGSY